MKVLVIDVGGSHIKLLATGQTEVVKITSGNDFTPQQFVADVLEATKEWSYDVVSIGFPAPIPAVCSPSRRRRKPVRHGTFGPLDSVYKLPHLSL